MNTLEEDHRDSIQTLIDSISFNTDSININNDSIQFIRDSIEVYADSITANKDDLELKVDKAGDTMTGPLLFEGNGIIGTTSTSNLVLQTGSTLVNNLLEPRKGLRVNGTIIETNDSYFAVSEEDIVDVKSLKENRRRVVVSQKTVTDGGGLLYKKNNDVITYRQSIKLQPIAEELLDSVQSVTYTVAIVDILDRFFRHITEVDTEPMAAPYDIVDEDML